MKDKRQILYERALITCVIMLFICVILKLFGANWFNFNTDLPLPQKINSTIMNNYIAGALYSWLLILPNIILVICISSKINIKTVMEHSILLFVSTMILILIVAYVPPVISMMIDTLYIFLIVFFINKRCDKELILNIVLTTILNLIYQNLSVFIRNIGYNIGEYSLIVAVLFNLDYYIMLFITYLYLMKKEVTLCQIIHHYGSCLAKRLCRKHLEN